MWCGGPNAKVIEMAATFWISPFTDASGGGTLLQYSQVFDAELRAADLAPRLGRFGSSNVYQASKEIKEIKDFKPEIRSHKPEVKEHKPEIKEFKTRNQRAQTRAKEHKIEAKELEFHRKAFQFPIRVGQGPPKRHPRGRPFIAADEAAYGRRSGCYAIPEQT